jgi:hypothetical protein
MTEEIGIHSVPFTEDGLFSLLISVRKFECYSEVK